MLHLCVNKPDTKSHVSLSQRALELSYIYKCHYGNIIGVVNSTLINDFFTYHTPYIDLM